MALSSEHSGFFNAQQTSGGEYDRTYDAEDFSNVFRQFLGNGIMITDEEAEKNTVFDKTTCGGLRTEASGNSIMYNDGWAFINGYWYHNSGGTQITPPSSVTNFKLVLALDLLGRRVETAFMQWDGTESDLDVDEGENIYEILLATGTRQANGTITNYTDRREKFITSSLRAVQNLIDNSVNKFYPVGSIYMSVNNVNPSQLFGGTWQSFGAGRVLVGVDPSQSEFNAVEKIGGAKTVTLNVNQIPAHNHELSDKSGYRYFVRSGISATGQLKIGNTSQGSTTVRMVDDVDTTIKNSGGGQSHDNLQPYITVYMWKRTR